MVRMGYPRLKESYAADMSFNNTGGKFEVGKEYQYQGDRMTDFGEKEIRNVILVKDRSNSNMYKLTFKDIDTDEKFDVEIGRGGFYYSGMPRVWPKGEYV